MKITFAQDGQGLRLTGDKRIVQYMDNVDVEITVDAEYASATEIVLLTQAHGLPPARCVLQLSGRTAAGKIKRAQLTQHGAVNFVMAAKINDAVLPTAAARIDVLPSLDPQGTELAQNPATIKDVISEVVASAALSASGYDGAKDLGKIAVVNANGDLAVRSVHLLIDDDTDGGSLVLRGAVGQEVASITIEELKEALGVAESEPIKNSYWSGYKYPDGRAVLRGTYTVNNLNVSKNTGMYVTSKLFNSLYRKYPALFTEKPEFRATYIPDASRVHMGVYATYQAGNSDTITDGTYQMPPDIYLACGDTGSQTLKGTLNMTVEGWWK